MNVNFLLYPEAVAVRRFETKPQVLTALSEKFAAVYGLDGDAVLDALEQREALGSTGFGRGVAIPHCRIEGIAKPKVVLIRLEHPVDFAAADAMPVSLVFGLVSPENAGATHLYTLAALSRLTRDDAVLQLLLDAPGNEAIYAVLTNQFLRDAA
jgi:PTS system nitrogen regulatory IIA component